MFGKMQLIYPVKCNEIVDIRCELTLLFHVDLQTLFEAAGLALIPACDIHHTIAVLFANVIQIPIMLQISNESQTKFSN